MPLQTPIKMKHKTAKKNRTLTIDQVDPKRYFEHNNGYNNIFKCIDVFAEYAICEPPKRETASAVMLQNPISSINFDIHKKCRVTMDSNSQAQSSKNTLSSETSSKYTAVLVICEAERGLNDLIRLHVRCSRSTPSLRKEFERTYLIILCLVTTTTFSLLRKRSHSMSSMIVPLGIVT